MLNSLDHILSHDEWREEKKEGEADVDGEGVIVGVFLWI